VDEMALKPVIRDRQIERHGDSIRNVTPFFFSLALRMQKFTSAMIDVTGRNFFHSCPLTLRKVHGTLRNCTVL
jgi:hypothetical protein